MEFRASKTICIPPDFWLFSLWDIVIGHHDLDSFVDELLMFFIQIVGILLEQLLPAHGVQLLSLGPLRCQEVRIRLKPLDSLTYASLHALPVIAQNHGHLVNRFS